VPGDFCVKMSYMNKATKRSHYLPRTYLKHFLLDDVLFMYMKGKTFFNNNKTPDDRILEVRGEAGLNTVGVKNNLYNPGIEGVSTDDLEEIFRGYGEDYYNDMINSINALPDYAPIPEEIKSKISYFAAGLRVRTPQFKNEIEETDAAFRKHFSARRFEMISAEEIIKLNKTEFNNEITIKEAREIKELIVNQKYDLKYPNGYFIKWALMLINRHADIFQNMSATIVRSNGRYFMTSDNPVVFFVPPERVNFYNQPKALVSPYTELFLPLSRNIAVTLNWRKVDEKVIPAKREVVDIFNENISLHSFSYIFTPIQMKVLNKFINEYIPYPFKIKVN